MNSFCSDRSDVPAGGLVGFCQQQQRNRSSPLAECLALTSEKQHGKAQPVSALSREQISHSQVHVTAWLFLGTPPSDLTLRLMGWRPTLIRDEGDTLHCCFRIMPEGTQADRDHSRAKTRVSHNPEPTTAAQCPHQGWGEP